MLDVRAHLTVAATGANSAMARMLGRCRRGAPSVLPLGADFHGSARSDPFMQAIGIQRGFGGVRQGMLARWSSLSSFGVLGHAPSSRAGTLS